MLYKKNQTSSLDPKLFQNPTSEYRGTPFWAWNCKVSKEDVDRTLIALKMMGDTAAAFEMEAREFFQRLIDTIKEEKAHGKQGI